MNLILKSISTDYFDLKNWNPKNLEDIFFNLVIEIGCDKNDGTNLFYVNIATPESLRLHKKDDVLVKNRTIILSKYSYKIIWGVVSQIINDCNSDSWEISCQKLLRYFDWEYEDYQ